MIINKSGIVIRMAVSECRVMGRATQGVRLINLAKKNDVIASVCKVMSSEMESEMEEESHMLAIEENGQWYFLQMKTPANLKILKMIYPDLELLPNLPSSSKIIPIETPKE